MPVPYDVLIAGGGLAGLCLARQLTREAPDLRVFLAERRSAPRSGGRVQGRRIERRDRRALLSEASSVSSRTCASAQLEKLGLRYFFPADDNRDIATRVELGPPAFPPVPSFQLDRGRLENMLLRTQPRGRRRRCSTTAASSRFELERRIVHRLDVRVRAAAPRPSKARWVVDASGRAGLLKRQLGLARPSRARCANACWFRFQHRA